MAVKTAAEIFRDFETVGDPSSGVHQPIKSDIREWGAAVETLSSAAIKTPCICATTGNIALSGLQTLDGHTTLAGDRVFVWKQTDPTANGVYDASSGAWTRSVDADASTDWTDGTEVFVIFGTLYGNSSFFCTTANPITLGASSLTFSGDRGIAGTLTITPAAASTAKGFSISQSGGSSGGSGVALNFNSIFVNGDNIAQSAASDDLGGFALSVIYQVGGSSMRGSRTGLMGQIVLTAPSDSSGSNLSHDRIGVIGWAQANSADGGTNTGAGALGGFFGMNPVALAAPGAINLYAVVGAEADTIIQAGASAKYRWGFSAPSNGAVQGAASDAAFAVYRSGTVSWKQGITFGQFASTQPIDSTGTVIGTDGSALTATNGIDFSAFALSGSFILGPGSKFSVNGPGSALGINGITILEGIGTTTPYNAVLDTAGNTAFVAGGGGSSPDPTNYLENTTTKITNIGGSTIFAQFAAVAIALNAATTFTVTQTIASATAAHWRNIYQAPATTTITGNTGSPITLMDNFSIGRPTLTDSSAVTITDAATLYIDNAPAAAGSVTITNPWALLVGAGAAKLQATTINAALTYGGVTLSNAVTGTGNMVLGTSPTFTTSATLTNNLAVNTSGDGLVLQNTTAATNNNQAYSPRIHLIGQGWETGTGASQTLDLILENQPIQAGGSANMVQGCLAISAQQNAGGYQPIMKVQINAASGAPGNTLTSFISPSGKNANMAWVNGTNTVWYLSNTGGSSDLLQLLNSDANGNATVMSFSQAGAVTIGLHGLVIGAPTGTDKGLGTINLAAGLYNAGNQVVGARITGYTAMTGTPDKATSFATSTVTLAQLAGRVMQLQADFTTHGLIGA